MKKNNIKKSILSLMLGLIFCLCCMPAINLANIFGAKAAPSDVYPTNETIDINGSFASSTSSVPDKWSLSSKYSNTNNGDSTSFNGTISSSLTSWDTEYDSIVNNIMDVLNANLTISYPNETQRQDILNAIKAELPAMNSPIVHSYKPGETTDFKILMLSSGKTYTQYVDAANVSLTSQDRTGFVTYTSNDFELDAYSYYKISVWVKTTLGAKASITIDGDIEKQSIKNITTENASTTEYYFYTFASGTKTTEFISTVVPGTDTITYDGLTYKFDNATQTYTPESAEQEYASYTIKSSNKSEIANDTDWVKKEIYISTVNKSSINLALSLGNSETDMSTGNVFFDEVCVEKIQLLDFVNATPSPSVLICDEREILANDPYSRDYTVVNDFETTHGWTVLPRDGGLEGTTLEIADEVTETKILETFPDSNNDGSNKVLKVDNYASSASTIKSGKFGFDQFGYYRVSIWGLSMQKNASLTVNIMATVNGSDVKASSKTSPYTSSRTNKDSTSITNYWVEYVFYVKGSPLYDTEGYFSIEVSKNTVVYFDNLVVERVTKTDYTDSKGTLLDLSTSALSDTITNGRFNNYDSIDYDEYSKPLPPASWTSTKTETIYAYYDDVADSEFTKTYFKKDLTFSSDKSVITLHGNDFALSADGKTYNFTNSNNKVEKIETVEDVTFTYNVNKGGYFNEKYDLTISSSVSSGIISGYNNPTLSPNGYTENALKIEALSQETFTYKSSSIKFETNAVLYNVYIDVMTDSTSRATLKLVDKDGTEYAIITNINTNNVWETYAFYVSSGYEAKELYLELTLDDSAGTIYFKKVIYKTVSNTTLLDENKTLSPSQIRAKNIALVDLAKESFIEHSEELNTTTKLYDTKLYTKKSSTTGTYGILDTKNADAIYSSIKSKDADVSSYVLVIKNTAGQTTTLDSLKTFTTVKKGYSKITVIAKATNLAEGSSATITFNGTGTTFNIENEEYTEYILYIDNSTIDKTLASSYTISLDGAGELVIDSISISKETSLESAKSENNNGKDSDTVKFVSTAEESETENTETEDTTEEETEDDNRTLEILMAIISSLLLVAAIVFAVIFTRLKAIKKPRKDAKINKVNSSVDDSQKGFI